MSCALGNYEPLKEIQERSRAIENEINAVVAKMNGESDVPKEVDTRTAAGPSLVSATSITSPED